MEDGSLLLFAAGEEGWRLCWRQKRHAKEVRDACFSHDGSTLCTVAPDGQCLIWPLEESGQLAEGPATLPPPPFTLHTMLASKIDYERLV